MLEKNEFERGVRASHDMFEIFEGRYDAYPLGIKWITQWFKNGKFTVNEDDKKRLNDLISNFDYNAFRNLRDREEKDNKKWKNLVEKIDNQFRALIESHLKLGEHKNIGVSIAPYLFTWNFQRFKEYFKKRDKFNLEQYFRTLVEFLQDKKEKLKYFRGRKLISGIVIEQGIKEVFQEINSKLKELGINQNEPVGTIKLLHIFATSFFPLIDNKIDKGIKLILRKWESLTSNSYLKWVKSVKSWLQNYFDIIEKLESEFNSSIPKLVDEGLYLMSSVNLRLRVKALGLEVN